MSNDIINFEDMITKIDSFFLSLFERRYAGINKSWIIRVKHNILCVYKDEISVNAREID